MSVSEPGPYPYLYPENPDWWNKNPPLPVFGKYIGLTSLLRQSNLSGSMSIIMQGFAYNQRQYAPGNPIHFAQWDKNRSHAPKRD